jgi:hypothetical protein
VPSREFFFAVDLPSEISPSLVRELVRRVHDGVCSSPGGAAELAELVEAAVADAGAQGNSGGFELRFEVQGGELDVTVRAGSRPVWQTSRPID